MNPDPMKSSESENLPDIHEYRSFTCACCGYTFNAPVYCGNRFCCICGSPRRRKIKAKITAIVDSLNTPPGFSIKLLTLTIPNVSEVKDGYLALTKSFRRLRQRQWFRNRTLGGCWVVEVTGSPGKWHVHAHVMLESRYLPHKVLVALWRSVSPGFIVHIKALPTKAIIGYITKYVSKSEVEEAYQLQVSEGLKGTRLFQAFGSWHAVSCAVKKIEYCCPHCDHIGFYFNGSGFSPEKYGADHCKGTLEHALRAKSIKKHPLNRPPWDNSLFECRQS